MTEAHLSIFIGLVADMRAWQTRYRRARSQEAYLRAREFEVLVDNALTGLLHPDATEPLTRETPLHLTARLGYTAFRDQWFQQGITDILAWEDLQPDDRLPWFACATAITAVARARLEDTPSC